jgi:hypothetical protein
VVFFSPFFSFCVHVDGEPGFSKHPVVSNVIGGSHTGKNIQPVCLAYKPPVSNNFLSQQISHQQPTSSTFLSKQTSTSHQPNEQANYVLPLYSLIMLNVQQIKSLA